MKPIVSPEYGPWRTTNASFNKTLYNTKFQLKPWLNIPRREWYVIKLFSRRLWNVHNDSMVTCHSSSSIPRNTNYSTIFILQCCFACNRVAITLPFIHLRSYSLTCPNSPILQNLSRNIDILQRVSILVLASISDIFATGIRHPNVPFDGTNATIFYMYLMKDSLSSVYIFISWNGVSATSFLPVLESLPRVDCYRRLYHSTSLERRARQRQRIRGLGKPCENIHWRV